MDYTYYIRVILALLAVLTVLYVIYRLTKRVQQFKYAGQMKVIDFLPVGSDSALLIVSVRDKDILLAKGSKELTYIKDL